MNFAQTLYDAYRIESIMEPVSKDYGKERMAEHLLVQDSIQMIGEMAGVDLSIYTADLMAAVERDMSDATTIHTTTLLGGLLPNRQRRRVRTYQIAEEVPV